MAAASFAAEIPQEMLLVWPYPKTRLSYSVAHRRLMNSSVLTLVF
jgi:hypothetical protein